MEIKCHFNIMKLIKFSAKNPLYVCVVTEAAITEPNMKIERFKGVHQPGKSDKDVDAISFNNSIVEYLPKGLGLFFPRLTFMQIKSCKLKSVSREDFIGLENLTGLMLPGNEIQSLPSNLFTLMRKLTKISFADNKIENMTSNLLTPLLKNKIVLLEFEGNTKINAVYASPPSLHPGHVDSIEGLTNLIDIICAKPDEDEPEITDVKFLEKMRDGFQQLRACGDLSDFVIKANDQKDFHVHKCVLAIQSPVFAAMFKNKMQEGESNEMAIADFGSSSIEEFLRYIYAGDIPDETNAMELFALSAKYDVPELKIVCEEMVLQNINKSNAFEVFALGHLHSSDNLKLLSFAEIKRMFPDTDLDNKLIDNPEGLHELMESKREYDQKLKQAKQTLTQTLNKFKKIDLSSYISSQ